MKKLSILIFSAISRKKVRWKRIKLYLEYINTLLNFSSSFSLILFSFLYLVSMVVKRGWKIHLLKCIYGNFILSFFFFLPSFEHQWKILLLCCFLRRSCFPRDVKCISAFAHRRTTDFIKKDDDAVKYHFRWK